MKNIVSDAPCPQCREEGRDKTGNHLMIFADGNKLCNRCGYFESNEDTGESSGPLPNGVALSMLDTSSKSYEPNSVGDARSFDFQTFKAYPIKALPDRALSQETCEYYGVRATLSQLDGRTVENVLFPLHNPHQETPVGLKTRTKDKKFYSTGEAQGDTFFGYNQALDALKELPASSRTLYITEGEFDAMSLYQTFKELSRSESKHAPVVSLRHGAASAARAMSNNKEILDLATKIVFVFDSDEPGKTAAEAAARVVGTKAHTCSLPLKDANDMLVAHREKELKKLALNAPRYMPAALATIDDLMEDILRKPEYGMSYPWPSLTNLTFGIRRGLLIGVAAGVGIGKTDWFSQLSAWLMQEHGEKTAQFKLEEQPARTIKAIAGKMAHVPFHRPDMPYDEQLLIDTVQSMKEHVYIYNHFGFKCWSDIKADIRTLTGYGVHYFIVDPLTALIAHEKDEHKALNEMMEEMAALTQELNITIFYSSHLNPPERSSKSHEEGGKVKESQLYGSRAMIRWSHYIFGLERNKHAVTETGDPDLIERNTTKFVLLKDREYGRTGEFKIYYNPETTDYLEPVEPHSSDKDF